MHKEQGALYLGTQGRSAMGQCRNTYLHSTRLPEVEKRMAEEREGLEALGAQLFRVWLLLGSWGSTAEGKTK